MAAPGASDTVIVVTGGDPLQPSQVPPLPAGAVVVAADSGVDHAHELGLDVHVAIGDFDSVSSEGLERATEGGAAVRRHPAEKDATDLELAMDAAADTGARRVLVLGGHGGRLDHWLANALLLAAPRYERLEVTAQMGDARLTVVRRRAVLRGPIGDLVSLVPVHGPARGVSTKGLLYPLQEEDLAPSTTRGVSNELVATEAEITLRSGVLVAVQPGRLGTHHGRTEP